MTEQMQEPTRQDVMVRDGQLTHVKWIDLKGNGTMVECAVMKHDQFGNYHYIEIPSMDSIDKNRMIRILTNRNAAHFELWELMSQITLNNGMNALDYFHQLVKVISPRGVISVPRQGAIGTGYMQTKQPAPAQ